MVLEGWDSPKGAPVPKVFGPASPHPSSHKNAAGLENAGLSAVALGAGYSGYKGGGRDAGREEVMARAVGKGSDSLLLPQTPLPLGAGACSALQHFLPPLLGMPPPPPPGLTVDGGQEAQLGLWGLNYPQKAPRSISSLGLALGLVVLLSYLE